MARMGEGEEEAAEKPVHTIEAIGIGAVLGRGTRIWLGGVHVFVPISLIVFLPLFAQVVFASLRPESFQEWITLHVVLALVGTFVLGWVVAATAVHGVFRRLRGRPVRLISCFMTGISSLPQVLLVWFLTCLGLFGACTPGVILMAIVGISGVALPSLVNVLVLVLLPFAAIPVFYFLCAMWSAPFVCVVEGLDAPDAIGRSWKLTQSNRLRIFGILLVLGLTAVFLGGIFVGSARALLPASGAAFVFVALAAVAASVAGVVSAVTYHDLRVVVEGVDAEALGAIFE